MSQPTRRVLRHVVLFAFKETATPTQPKPLGTGLAALHPRSPRSDFE
jgi:hypothetical protein